MVRSITVPDAVRRRALSHGALGAQWLRDLPAIVADIERRWDITVGATLTGGTAAYVAEATTRDGAAAVLKVATPPAIDGATAFAQMALTLELAGGHGCARLLARDDERAALLLERLGRSLGELDLSVERELEIICRTVQPVWVRVPRDTPLPTGAEKAHWLSDFIETTWEALDRPCSRGTIDLATAFAAERAAAFDPASAVLVHGDAHRWNTLEAAEGTFKLVDPEGLVSEPAHDLAIPMREFNRELLEGDAVRLGRERAQLLGRLTGVNPTAIWQWGFIERVSTGLHTMELGFEGGHEYLEIADHWAGPS